MNIVKGVTDLIRRTSGGQTGESGSSSLAGKFSAPSPRIRFGEIGDEAVLHTLWQRYENAIDKVEKKKLLHLFFMHFIRTYKNWEPVCSVQSDQTPSSSFFALEHRFSEDVVVGCSSGHPAEIIYILIQEIVRITALVTDLNTSVTQSNPALSEASINLSILTEGLHVLDVLTIIIRSMHNCRVFSYYGGVQKLTALMKAAVVQLKTLFSTLAADEVLSQSSLEKTKVLQKILTYVVSVIHTLMDFNSSVCEKSSLHASSIGVSFLGDSGHDVVPLNSLKGPVSEARFHWQQKAITLVMEAGGLNWLVELLRVIRRLNMKAQWTEISLQYLTLVTLRSALSGNPRAQNHFRSIGGLEVLLDGLGLPSSNYIVSKTAFQFSNERNEDYFYRVFHLQILSLEVLRESTFGNLYNLQFLCENGRVHKFANSICWPAFMVQEFQQHMLGLSISGSRMISQISTAGVHEDKNFASESCFSGQSDGNASSNWSAYAAKLSQALCSFLLTPEDIKVHQLQGSVGQSSMSASISYWELAVKWFMKVLFTLFPCIKACSNQTVLPSHIRILSNILQHYILFAFRKLLISSATLFEVFRQEGIWDLIFSESFFYFKGVSEEISGKSEASLDESDIIQMEVISFLEFAATLTGNTHNVPECSALLDALEQSSCNPEIASVLVKSLHRILQLSNEQTISSFKTLGAIARILKVACIQAEEFRKLKAVNPSSGIAPHLEISPKDLQKNSSCETAEVLVQCMAASMEIFTEFVSVADNARSLILHDTICIDCLFDLFWEEGLQEDVLQHILDLMKLDLASSEDHMAKLYLCCKYLETFNHAKEREKDFVQLSIDLLVGMRDVVLIDPSYYQDLFRDGECFLHIVSLLNGMLDEKFGEQLVLNVLETLTFLLSGNDVSKGSFKALVGAGYQTLQNLLLDICHWQPTSGLLDALLDMLVDGKFSIDKNPVIKNEDVIILFFSVLQKSSESLRNYGLDIFQRLLKDSISNRTSCVRAGMLSFLLDWFPLEVDDGIIMKISQLIQIVGGHSISGKDIRRIFALLRSEKIGSSEMYCTLLLNSIHSMLKDKGPTSFFDFSGVESGIVINTPVQWPYSKGFSFSCWIRVEKFPEVEMMDLFHFLTDNGRGCSAILGKERLTFESVNQKRQMVSMYLDLVPKKWHFLCITHSIGRAFSGGSMLRCYVDGNLVSTEKCRYAKINDLMTHCTIGKFDAPPIVEENSPGPVEGSSPFIGQIGPIYMFGDALSSDQIKGIYYLGPNYMYSFHGNEVEPSDAIRSGIFDAKDGLASKIIFGLNAQASDGRNLFNVSSMIDHVLDKNIFEAKVMAGTQLCSRRLLQQIIYCVGGVSVFFPLLTQFDGSEEENGQSEYILIKSIARDKLAAEVIELVASVLDGNLANQQQMHLLSGFSIIGFLFQSVPPEQLNIKTVTSLKHMLDIVRNCGLSELLMKDAISKLYLNPHIWVYANYDVQRDLYMFLIKYFENDARLLTALCGLPRIIDIIRQFYWDKLEGRSAFGSKPLLHPTTGRIIGERPGREEIHKIRLLLLSLVEMSLRQEISASDIKSLVAFFEKSQDMVCIEDVLHMVIRALSRKELLASFIEQVNMLGGGHIFVNVLGRELEPIRLLGLQFIGKLLVGLPSEKKGQRFFNLTGNKSKSLTDSQRKANLHLQAFYQAVAEKLFKYPLSDHLCATLFDVLLGGASPKQVLQKRSQSDNYQSRRSGSSGTSSHFFLPQILVLIFKFLGLCEDSPMRKKVLGDLLNLLDSNPSNIEALMEYGWNSWLETSLKFGVFKNHKVSEIDDDISEERNLVRNVFSLVLSHYMYSMKGGYLQFEETVNFLLLQREQGELSSQILLRTIIEDLIGSLVDLSSDENIFVLQPCRDNTLYLLKLADEMLISELGCELLFPISSVSADHSSDFLELERQKDIKSAIIEALNGDADGQLLKQRSQGHESFISSENDVPADQWWKLYDKLWVLICAMNGKGPSKIYSRTSTTGGPSFGQRARGLVESLNIPAAEMAAVVVSGSIGNALGGKTSKGVDKAMLLRGEKCPRIIFRLVILYLSKSVLERASKCVQQFISLLPCLLASDDEHSKSRLHLFIWSLLATRKLSGMLDDGARFQLISHLIRETVNFGKSMIATSILGREDSSDASSSMKEISSINNLIQKERLLVAVVDEVRFMKTLITDRLKQLQEFHVRMDEAVSMDIRQRKMFDDENCINLEAILSSDDSRRVASQLAYDEDQQIVAEKWIHMFRALIDERGPWSAYSFPNEIVTHWKLDKTEDLWRRRPKLRRNYHFDEKLCHPPTITCNTATHLNESHSGTGSHFPEQMKHFLLKGVRGITEEVSLESIEDDTELSGMTSSLDKSSESEASDVVKDSKDQTDTALDRKDQSSSTAETEFSNEVLLSIPSVLITPKRKLAGRLAIMRHVLHFFGEFLVEGTGGSSVFKSFSDLINHGSTKSEQLTVLHKQKLQKFSLATVNTLPDNLVQDQQRKIKRHRRWNVGKIKAVHWTRYLLQHTAIEIFFHDSVAPVFLNFASQKDAKDAGMLIVSKRNELLSPRGNLKDKNGAISFIDRRIAVEMAENARESWRRREMSNFEYLMVLNTLAGRSYNDLTQYPVFPWVLADYSSEKLDFNKSSTFRDLSKPVGALDIKRFEVFEDRYHNFCDPDIPSFYYGSHYSSMGIVLYYLLRLEPFTALHRNLQGGKFDHADRLFQSIEGTYRNCLSNTSDVKELIPEFFYMPEFLTNSNSYHLGVKQDGEPLGDVSLPPWAKGSLEEFISKNREALESEYVSSNLHHWIDLVFGYKQRGKPAVEAANIFYYLTYEGAVDMDAMEDESQRLAIEDQIANFGQTPIQIFRKKHPRRGPPIPIAHPLYFAPASITLTSMISISSSAIQYIGTMESNIVFIDQSLTMSIKMWLSTQMQSGGNFTFSVSQEPFFGIGSDVLTRKVGIPLAENIELGAQCFTTLQTPNENFMVLCGNWENSFQVISLNDGRMVQNIRQHKDVVSCLAVSSDGSVLATGSYDTTVMVWEVSRARMTEKRFRNAQSELPRRDYVIVENPVHILCGHDDIITCLYVSVELDIVISGSRDGTCIFHTLRDGKYVRSIRHPSNGPLSRLAASQHGRVVFYADNDLSLHMYSINGKHIATSESNGRINCVAISSCGEFLVCAGDHGHIFLRSMHSLDIVKRYEGVGKIITSLTVTPEECFLAGTKDGNLLIYSIENPQLRRGSLQRNMKSKSYATG